MRRNREQPSGLKPTVSEQAARMARTTRPFRVPIPLPSPAIAPLLRAIRRRVQGFEAPQISALQERLTTAVSPHEFSGVRVLEITPRSLAQSDRPADDYAVYLHGGAYFLGTAADTLGLLMADELRMRVFAIDYDMAPDAPFPTALDQAVRAYTQLAEAGTGESVLFGVSSGGGLALSLTNRLRRLGLPGPCALGLFTPWCDLTGAGDSRVANEGRDRAIRWRFQLERAAGAYAGRAPADDPGISPIYDEYPGDYPPSIITTGTRDLFLSDCVRLYWKLRAAEAVTELRVWEGMWHALPNELELPESRHCRAEVGGFLLQALDARRGERDQTAVRPPSAA